MTRKSITTSHAVLACDVCGRTLLRGESADAFIAGGSRRIVCELCIGRATNEGWIREGADQSAGVARHGNRRTGSLLGRLLRDRPARPTATRTDRRAGSEPLEDAPPPVEHDAEPARPAPDPPTYEPIDPVTQRPPYDPAREPRHVRAVPTNADLKMARALDLFNASRHPRTVSGVSRSLGLPTIAVLPSATEGAMVTIVVSWELCWYRYEVDLADEAAGVRVTAQGQELSELAPEEQHANAGADERGELSLAA